MHWALACTITPAILSVSRPSQKPLSPPPALLSAPPLAALCAVAVRALHDLQPADLITACDTLNLGPATLLPADFLHDIICVALIAAGRCEACDCPLPDPRLHDMLALGLDPTPASPHLLDSPCTYPPSVPPPPSYASLFPLQSDEHRPTSPPLLDIHRFMVGFIGKVVAEVGDDTDMIGVFNMLRSSGRPPPSLAARRHRIHGPLH